MALLSQPWAIEERSYRALEKMLEEGAFAASPAAALPEAPGKHRRNGSVALVPLRGIVTARRNAFLELFGLGASSEGLVQSVSDALMDPEVAAVVLDVESPGGTVAGTPEAATQLAALRASATKPIVAVSDYLSASAAYWLTASAAHELVASPSSLTGSIGVIAAHVDASGAYEQEGINIELIYAGQYKAEGADIAPLTTEARAYVQAQVDVYYDQFVRAVAAGRRTTADVVRANYGRGRVLTAITAKAAGLVDAVDTLAGTIARLQTPQARAVVMRRDKAELPNDGNNLRALIASVMEERNAG